MTYKRAPLIAYLCLLPILLSLGVWQLNRAEEKRVMLSRQAQQQTGETLVLTANTPDESEKLLYKPVKAVGQYDNAHQFLLDNQINKGRVGYFVFTPFLFKNEHKAVLVNRGWVPLGKNRADLPTISVDNQEITLEGRINHFPGVGMKLVGAEQPTHSWPAVVQLVDVNVLANHLGYSLFDFQIELDKAAAQGFIREWHEPFVMTPEKHIAYAVQWFLLAFTLTVLFIKYGFKKS